MTWLHYIYLYIWCSVFTPCHNFLWTLWALWGERATSDISSWAHLINKWINYARFMGWCTSKHFKGHGECPWGAIMRGSSARRQIWWPRFSWTWSFSHFVCTCSFQFPALRLFCFSCFLSHSLPKPSPPPPPFLSLSLSSPLRFFSQWSFLFLLSSDLKVYLIRVYDYHPGLLFILVHFDFYWKNRGKSNLSLLVTPKS